jgi:hypothetical protein
VSKKQPRQAVFELIRDEGVRELLRLMANECRAIAAGTWADVDKGRLTTDKFTALNFAERMDRFASVLDRCEREALLVDQLAQTQQRQHQLGQEIMRIESMGAVGVLERLKSEDQARVNDENDGG